VRIVRVAGPVLDDPADVAADVRELLERHARTATAQASIAQGPRGDGERA
jgi:hypothetical protein